MTDYLFIALVAYTLFAVGAPFLHPLFHKTEPMRNCYLLKFMRRNTGAKVMVEDDSSMNAYCMLTLRGYVIVITRGNLERLMPHELKAVLLHEAGHVELMHIPQQFILFTMFLSAAVLSHSWLFALLMWVPYRLTSAAARRAQEFAADKYAVRVTGKHALISAFGKSPQSRVKQVPYIASHPTFLQRAEAL